MTPYQIDQIIDGFADQKVLVLGDAMIDSYLWGHIERMSPEAPVPVVNIDSREERLGGAANVALNCQSLGATPILCSVIGQDPRGDHFMDLMQRSGLNPDGIVRLTDRPTTVKTRVISDDKHVLRVDQESVAEIDFEILLDRITTLFDTHTFNAVIVEDYNKGMLTPPLIESVINLAHERGAIVSVDPKKNHYWAYKNVDLFKPNWKELIEALEGAYPAEAAAQADIRSTAIRHTRLGLTARCLLLTLSENGVVIQNDESEFHFPVYNRNIIDVSGAGDSVISVATLVYAQKVAVSDVARFANLAGGLVCEQVGVVPIDLQILRDQAHNHLT